MGGDGDGGCVKLGEQAVLATESTKGGTRWALIIPITTLSLLLLAGLFFLRRKYRSKKRLFERSASPRIAEARTGRTPPLTLNKIGVRETYYSALSLEHEWVGARAALQ